ncbi:hypothetical protein K458DRAFT_394355 [Lentithecium fluviatile CBS 122367]|uniref:Uncharacterized protein n=1 Tax=Lentithecium fluviatile CBS 122367 TaxID=1168545 RepID=A0A6G1IL26_9PLEO|nr:hypothetical protein K458DRAFT_394355 [Lentithecium fluviatile CBS 122367]
MATIGEPHFNSSGISWEAYKKQDLIFHAVMRVFWFLSFAGLVAVCVTIWKAFRSVFPNAPITVNGIQEAVNGANEASLPSAQGTPAPLVAAINANNQRDSHHHAATPSSAPITPSPIPVTPSPPAVTNSTITQRLRTEENDL